jgi:hypothetical protein
MADPKEHGEFDGDYARDTHREGLGGDYARDGGWSGGGRRDDLTRDPDSEELPDSGKASE